MHLAFGYFLLISISIGLFFVASAIFGVIAWLVVTPIRFFIRIVRKVVEGERH